MSNAFIGSDPAIDDYWRGIILYGRNVASYKFALAKALLHLRPESGQLVKFEELALPYAQAISEHLKVSDKQATSASSRFLDGCREYNRGALSESDLIAKTVQLGFDNVIDAFHVVGNATTDVLFFADERSASKGVRVTDELSRLYAGDQIDSLIAEVEARWRLVETSWQLGISRNHLQIEHDVPIGEFVVQTPERRISVTSTTSALNGYQKGACFYCFRSINVGEGKSDADVDHFFPFVLVDRASIPSRVINGVWNLVLACRECNRGVGGKFEKLPTEDYLYRLQTRNDFLIDSHHPLRETLIRQTGRDRTKRHQFLKSIYNTSLPFILQRWSTEQVACPRF